MILIIRVFLRHSLLTKIYCNKKCANITLKLFTIAVTIDLIVVLVRTNKGFIEENTSVDTSIA